MTDWIKILGSVGAAAILMWNLVQAHELRINSLEKAVEKHVDAHDTQYRSIQQKLTEIQVDVSRIAGARDGR